MKNAIFRIRHLRDIRVVQIHRFVVVRGRLWWYWLAIRRPAYAAK